MLAVAPRGRLSWIPNISWAPRLQLLPPPPYDHNNKTTPGENRKRKVQQKKPARGQTERRRFSSATSETSGSPKAAGRVGNKRSRKKRWRKMKKKRVEVVTPEFYSTAQLWFVFRFNSTFDSGRTKEAILEDF